MSKFCQLRGYLLGGLLLSCLPVNATGTVLHRAVEPAQVQLDVTVENKNLTLYLSIPLASLSFLAPDDTPQTLIDHLHRPQTHWSISKKAKCSAQNRRIFSADEDVQVVYEFQCQAPDHLEHIRSRLLVFLPGLKQINTWVSTDSSQNKQVVNIPGGIINLHPAGT